MGSEGKMGVNNKKSGVWDEKGRVQCGERWNDEGHTVSLLWLGCDLVALDCGWESWRHNWAPFYYVTLSILLPLAQAHLPYNTLQAYTIESQ